MDDFALFSVYMVTVIQKQDLMEILFLELDNMEPVLTMRFGAMGKNVMK